MGLFPQLAFADCPILKEALKDKEEEALDFDAKNRAMLMSLIATETSCKNKGAKVSGDLAKAAEALTCQALQDANQVNLQMENLGNICTDAFSKRNQLQQLLQNSYAEMISDVEDGTEYILKSQILMEDCPKEAKKAKKLRERARELATEISNVELRSRDGKDNYGKFKDAAAAMAMLTAARNKGCSTGVIEKVSATREAALQRELARAPPPPPQKRVSGTGPSDITGVEKMKWYREPDEIDNKISRPEWETPSELAGRTAGSVRSESGRQGPNAQYPSGKSGGEKLSQQAGKTASAVDRVQPKPEELLGDLALLAGKDGNSTGKESGQSNDGTSVAGMNSQENVKNQDGELSAGSAVSGVRTPASNSQGGATAAPSWAETSSGVKRLREEEVLDGVKELNGLREGLGSLESPDAVAGLDSVDIDLFKRVSARYRKKEKRLQR